MKNLFVVEFLNSKSLETSILTMKQHEKIDFTFFVAGSFWVSSFIEKGI